MIRLISKLTLVSLLSFSYLFANAQKNDIPVIGAQVFIEPGQKAENVEIWFKSLADAGMDVCRIRMHEVHLNNNGKWDFSIYDHAFDCASKNNIKVFATLFPSDSKNSVGGEKFPETKKHFKSIGNYIDKVVTHYKDHPALYAWVLQNEPGVEGVIPQTEFTQYAFEQWKKNNKSCSDGGFITNSYDNKKFLLDYECWFLDWIAQRVKKNDETHYLHINNHQIFKNVAEYDFPYWRTFLSSLGASAHPSWHFGYFSRDQYTMAMAANCNIIKSGAGELPYWMTELQGGNNLFSGNIPICPTDKEITQWLWTCIGNGAEGVIFWSLNPRSATGEPGEWALLTLDNKSSERMDAAKEVIDILKTNGDIFFGAKKYDIPVTVLYNRESLWAEEKMQHAGVRNDEGRSVGAVMKETMGIYQALTENGIIPSIAELREFDWKKEDYSGHLMFISHQISIPDEFIENIENFVARGGRLVVTGLTGFWGSSNICTACTDFLFKDVLGASFKEVKHISDEVEVKMEKPYLTLPSHMWISTLYTTTATPVAYHNNEPIAVRNSFGKGNVLWIPSLVGLGKRRYDDMNLAHILRTELAHIEIPVMFSNPHKNVVMNTMSSENGLVTIIVNKSKDSIILPLAGLDDLSGKLLYSNCGGNLMTGNLVNINPEETIIISWK